MEIYTVIGYIIPFFEMLVAAKLIGVFYEKRRTSYKTMLLSILFAYIVLLFFHVFDRDYLPPIWMIAELFIYFLGCFAITLNYKSSVAKRFVVIITIYMILISISTIVTAASFYIFPGIALNSDAHISISASTSVLIGYVLAVFIRRFKNIRKNNSFPRVVLIVPLVSLIPYLILMLSFIYEADMLIEIFAIFFQIIVASFIFITFYLYDTLSGKYEEKIKSALHEQEKEYYFTQCQLMQESVEKVKSVRHDMRVHFAALTEFAANNKTATEYINSLLGDIEKSEIYSETGNIAFDSIINFKLKNIKGNNIKLDVKLDIPPVLNVEVADIVTILGSLLDNALDAVEKTAEKLIKIDIKFNRGELSIKIENSFDGTVKHTYGNDWALENVRQSIEKYNGYMKITRTENIFSASAVLYVKETRHIERGEAEL